MSGKSIRDYINLIENAQREGVSEADKLQGTPVVSLSDFGDKDTKKDKYGRTVPKKLKKDDPRVKFHKDTKQQGVAEEQLEETSPEAIKKIDQLFRR